MENKVFILSDIHLEGKSKNAQDFMLQQINKLIAQNKESGIIPTLVLPGDVHNGIQGLEWMGKIKANIIYTCGNHEFWENDFQRVLTQIPLNLPPNVTFLYNDLVQIDNHIFIGGTMWSDVGQTLNPDLFKEATHTMNDSNRIKNANWYTDEKNIEKLKNTYSEYTYQQMIENNYWNTIMEVEENTKTINFFNDFANMLLLLKKIPIEQDYLKIQLNSSYQPLTEDQYHNKLALLNDFQNLSFKEWVEKMESSEDYRFKNMIKNYNVNNPNNEIIFNKLKLMNLENKIVAVSHHLPFLEEKLIGRQDWSKNNEVVLENKLKEEIYTIRNGLDYPDQNYFFNMSKGRYSRDDSILTAIHYCNNGSVNLSQEFIENISVWIHGHDHHYNYQDFIKGMAIATNPMGYSMSIFQFENDILKLGKSYVKYHNISPEEEENEINEITKSFIRPININYKNEAEKEKIVKFWVLKNTNLEQYQSNVEILIELNKRLFNMLIKKPQLKYSDTNSKEGLDIISLSGGIDYHIVSLEEKKKELNSAVAIRLDPKFSFMNKLHNLINGKNILDALEVSENEYVSQKNKINYTQPYVKEQKLVVFRNYETLVDICFFNIVKLKKDLKVIIKTREYIENVENPYIHEIDINNIGELFVSLPYLYDYEKGRQEEIDLMNKKELLIKKYNKEKVKSVGLDNYF